MRELTKQMILEAVELLNENPSFSKLRAATELLNCACRIEIEIQRILDGEISKKTKAQ